MHNHEQQTRHTNLKPVDYSQIVRRWVIQYQKTKLKMVNMTMYLKLYDDLAIISRIMSWAIWATDINPDTMSGPKVRHQF